MTTAVINSPKKKKKPSKEHLQKIKKEYIALLDEQSWWNVNHLQFAKDKKISVSTVHWWKTAYIRKSPPPDLKKIGPELNNTFLTIHRYMLDLCVKKSTSVRDKISAANVCVKTMQSYMDFLERFGHLEPLKDKTDLNMIGTAIHAAYEQGRADKKDQERPEPVLVSKQQTEEET